MLRFFLKKKNVFFFFGTSFQQDSLEMADGGDEFWDCFF